MKTRGAICWNPGAGKGWSVGEVGSEVTDLAPGDHVVLAFIPSCGRCFSCVSGRTHLWVNCHNIYSAGLPFGGYKESGWGREQGAETLELYLETKSVCVQL